jgi:hypothetical protein
VDVHTHLRSVLFGRVAFSGCEPYNTENILRRTSSTGSSSRNTAKNTGRDASGAGGCSARAGSSRLGVHHREGEEGEEDFGGEHRVERGRLGEGTNNRWLDISSKTKSSMENDHMSRHDSCPSN